jgi:signal transduction histidine kinase
MMDWFPDLLSFEIRSFESQQEALRVTQLTLPEVFARQQTDRIGYHSLPDYASGTTGAHTAPDSRFVRLDLGSVQKIDAIVLIAADYAYGDDFGPGYGFPVRYRVEVSDDVSFSNLRVVADRTGADVINPRRSPVVIDTPGIRTRFIRITAINMYTREGSRIFALGEVMVMQNGINLALGLPPSQLYATDSDETPPAWSLVHIVDGQSSLGPPQGLENSPTEGYHSAAAATIDSQKWVTVDLGADFPLDEIRLFPTRANEYAARRGFGFPRRFKVELSIDVFFTQPIVISDATKGGFPRPNENVVAFRVPQTSARFIRVTATRLSERMDDFVFSLSELEAYSGGRNVARDAAVTAMDSRESGIWSTRYLTDGFTSLRDIIPWMDFLRGVQRRSQNDARIWEIMNLRREASRRIMRNVMLALGWTVAVGVVAAILFVWRQRRVRTRELAAIQAKLAQDIHDEIGSGLGTISLLSSMGGSNAKNSPSAREEFEEIQRITREVTENLRDIVWFIRPNTRTVGDLAQRLRETAEGMLSHIPHEVQTTDEMPPRELPLEHKRQVLMAFKEAIHNLIRHSGATRAAVLIGADARHFRFAVSDNGRGFDPNRPCTGAGMASMKQRAKTLRGRFVVDSKPGGGTTLTMEIPWA